MSKSSCTVLIVDLNNFSRYPSVAIGYLCSILRKAFHNVDVISPFFHGLNGVAREPTTKPWGLLDQKLRYWSASSEFKIIHWARNYLTKKSATDLHKHEVNLLLQFEKSLENKKYDIILISTYLMYKGLCEKLCKICKEENLPVIIGGPYFAQKDVAQKWSKIEGLTSLFSGEPDQILADLVFTTALKNPASFRGIIVTDNPFKAAMPQKGLDSIPFPDYSDFPWDKYSKPIIPIITGRGCGWGRCQFCSDITSSSGRSFRTRSPENVLNEIEFQSIKHQSQNFVFTDLKLNSNTNLWSELINNIQLRAPGAKWICSLHIGENEITHLNKEMLKAAAKSGLTRITTGLESGSQRVLDLMSKGAKIEDISSFIKNTAEAGISVRTTMILGYPGETAEDVKASAKFLESHAKEIDRVMINRFQLIAGTPIHRRIQKNTFNMDGFEVTEIDHESAMLGHKYSPSKKPSYRKEVNRLLAAAHNVNRKKLSGAALEFEGIM